MMHKNEQRSIQPATNIGHTVFLKKATEWYSTILNEFCDDSVVPPVMYLKVMWSGKSSRLLTTSFGGRQTKYFQEN